MPRKLRSESWLRLSRNGQSTKCGPALKALVKRWLSSRPKSLLLSLLIGKPLGQFTAWRVVPESPAMCLSGVSASLGGNPGRVIVQREVSAAGTGPCQRSLRQPGAGAQTQPLESTAPALGGLRLPPKQKHPKSATAKPGGAGSSSAGRAPRLVSAVPDDLTLGTWSWVLISTNQVNCATWWNSRNRSVSSRDRCGCGDRLFHMN